MSRLPRPRPAARARRVVERSGVRSTFQFTGEAKASKGLRKYYKTTAELAGMKPINVELTHGHSVGTAGHYFRPAESDVLKDYLEHAADALTIDPTPRLEKENQELRTTQAQQIARLEARLNDTEQLLDTWRKVAHDNRELSLGKYLGKDGKWHHESGFELS